ncbi:BACON domain-containing protein [Arenibacter latericius]|uniref:BACON domain-containing protein n=1 Tax=Arenibacter latericius TaxID=86104 RepID=UPI00040113B0|nr:BACON domain-containing carbohydrate-binding protein [Arenibacter latericius]
MNKKIHFKAIAKLLIGVFVMFHFVGCDKNKDSIDPKLVVSRDSYEVSNGDNQYNIDLLSNTTWEAQANVEWITLEMTSGTNGRIDLPFSVIRNEDDERVGTITITLGEGVSYEILVTQEAGNTDNIYVRPNGTGDGFSWNEATDLATALNLAVSGNTIHIAEGTYNPSETITGGDSENVRDLTFEISRNISLVGGYPINATKDTKPNPEQYKTILNGNNSSYHVVTVSAVKEEGAKVKLVGLTITSGHAGDLSASADINGLGFRRDYGGGITIGNAVVDIRDTHIIDNKSEKFAAGLYAFADAVVTIDGSEVSNNSSSSNVGGIWIREAKAFISNTKILANSGGTAAGVHGYPDAEIYMNNSIVADNKGRSYGAGFYIRQNSIAILTNCMITGNSSTSKNGGGGIMMYNNNKLTLINTTIIDNAVPTGPGGGIFRRSGENELSLYNSIVSGNKQLVDGEDIDVFEADAQSPQIISSISASKVIDHNGVEIDGITFNHTSMLQDHGDYVILPVGEDNPALLYGTELEELVRIGNQQEPKVEADVISSDLLNNSRSGLKTMGAVVKFN